MRASGRPHLLGMRRAPRDRDLHPRIHLFEIERARARRVGIAIPCHRLPRTRRIHRLQHLPASSPVVHARAFQVRHHNRGAAGAADLACLAQSHPEWHPSPCEDAWRRARLAAAASLPAQSPPRWARHWRRHRQAPCSSPARRQSSASPQVLAHGGDLGCRWRRDRGGPCGCCAVPCDRQTQPR